MNIDRSLMQEMLSDIPLNFYTQASYADRELFKNCLKSLLKKQKVTVEFEKSDGTHRVMICTLSEDDGAKYNVTENKINKREPNAEVCPVWDCEQMGWRSFRWDRLRRIDFSIG